MPWLKGFVEPSSRVLEVGLGFGSVGQFLADNSSSYVGIDIAEGPVNLMKYRLVESPQKFTAICTDVLDMPLADASQDVVVAIGSLHHVGDFESAVKEIARVLGPNGRLAGMVYASFSLRSIFRDPKRTALALVGGWKKQARFSDSPRLRSAADVNSTGDPAPFTEFFSKASLRAALASDFEQVAIVRRNASSLPFVGQGLRRATLSKPFQWFFSLDLYFTATVKNP